MEREFINKDEDSEVLGKTETGAMHKGSSPKTKGKVKIKSRKGKAI